MSAARPHRISARRAAAGLLAMSGLVIAPAFLQAAAGQPDPGSPDEGRGAPDRPAAAAQAAPECELVLGDAAKDEFATCSEVALTFATTPDVGATTRVDIEVTSVKDLHGATLTLGVNDLFDLTSSSGFADAGTQLSGVGPLSTVSRTVDVTAGQTTHLSVEVTGSKAGIGIVQARLDTTGGAFDSGDELDVQLGQAAPTSPRGIRVEKVPAGIHVAAAPRGSTYHRPPSQRAGARGLDPGTPGASCTSGRFLFQDEAAVWQPTVNFSVEVYDDDPMGTDDLLATGLTNPDGAFNICFESTDEEGGGQELFVNFVAENGAWRFRNTPASDSTWRFFTGITPLADPGTLAYGDVAPPALYHRLLHAFDAIDRLFLWHADYNGYLDNAGDSRQMLLNWTPTSVDGTYYSTVDNDIHLAAADPDADHVTIHEAGHALMDALYDDNWPPVTGCNPHSVFGTSSATCAWTEGWAEWLPARVLDDPFFRWPDGSFLNLETPSWADYTGAYGDTVEGRVAGALIDLSDSANDTYWDRYTEGAGSTAATEEIYTTMAQTEVSNTFNEYFSVDRAGEGDTGYFARAALFQNTIDYTHRDPLVNTEELVRPSLDANPTPHLYSAALTNGYWNAVALRQSASGSDFDLRLFADEAMTNQIGLSEGTAGATDYILVDGNHRTGTFFPRADLFWGSGTYSIEEYLGNSVGNMGATPGSFTATDIIKPWDVQVVAGQTQYIGVQPVAGLDVSIFAHVSDGTSATTTQSRYSAVASGQSNGPGELEYLTYSAPIDGDWTNVVVLNESGTAGNYVIYRDITGPSAPAVQADGGNAQTYDTTVDLTLSATPANTLVNSMQISTDGVFDFEPWVPYFGTGTATLPAGLGTKTVSVRYRAMSGAISATATDTITMVATPTCDGQTATVAGFGAVNGTSGADVIVGGPGPNSIAGFGGNDLICGLGGNDTINDGLGADTVYGESGNDVFTQPAGTDVGDVFDGGSGTDQVSYGARSGNVTVTLDGNNDDGVSGEGDTVQTNVENVTTGGGNDTLLGTSAANRLIGNGGNDTVTGGGGNDYVTGNGGVDTLRGGDGNDTILAGDGDDTIDEGATANGSDLIKGGTGADLIDYGARTAAVAIRLTGVATSGAAGENDKLLNCEKASGGTGDDTIVGHVTADTLAGGAGNDTLTGNGNDDTMHGGPGADVLNGGNGNDNLTTLDGVGGNDTANGGGGTDFASTDIGDIRISIP
ncbi:hypothetical protein F0U44_07380 [Nocardioides humilatus]|uniref:Calcium-binding protein n=1 Tax=Nocardioides humilatus TaxID=2607660 RepID=A0A5B1LHV6_9ACTN|nr:hypothetical protein [Nocardioides humilatus]KAA1420233.1 hypothetical protein F0U44_07380 [Nocardioides humilatus]